MIEKIDKMKIDFNSVSVADFADKINEIIKATNENTVDIGLLIEERPYKDNGSEPYIPSVHLKNVAPLEWLESKEGKDFIDKLREFENKLITKE